METEGPKITTEGASVVKKHSPKDFSLFNSKIIEISDAPLLRQANKNRKIVQCHGVFDVLHAGHLSYLESAKTNGDMLVVTVTDDAFVNKGPSRPYFSSGVRAKMLAALKVVDYVIISRFPLAVPTIEALKPNYYVKGPDYKDRPSDVTGGIYLEEEAVKSGGGEIVFTSDETFSSSQLINSFFDVWTPEQEAAINKIKELGGYARVEEVLKQVASQKILVSGEPIVDHYVFCRSEGLSSKRPAISARYLYEEEYAGGSLAIANHLSGFSDDVTLLITHGSEPYFKKILKNKLNPTIKLVAEVLKDIPTPKKTRFISEDKVQRFFEVTNIATEQWKNHSPENFCLKLSEHAKCADAVIVADFGHGLFEGPVLKQLSDIDKFVGLNVQTNSSNFGFNPFTKHRKFSFLCIDTREARVACYDRTTPILDLAQQMREKSVSLDSAIAITLGPDGAKFYPTRDLEGYASPAFAGKVVDALGAGDAFFALTSMLLKVDCPPEIILFLGNVFAGLQANIIGNKSPLKRAQLLRSVDSILK